MGSGAELNCGQSCLKYLLIVFNAIFFVCGATLLGVGLWIRFDPKLENIHKVATIDDTNVGTAACYFIIALGCFIFIIGMVGCCGACNESKCLLGLYAAFVGLIMILQIAAAITAAVYRKKIDEEIQGELYRQIREDFRLDVTSTEEAKKYEIITEAWNLLQQEFKCCGANAPSDYTKDLDGTTGTLFSMWKTEVDVKQEELPASDRNVTNISYPRTCCEGEPDKNWKDANFLTESNYTICQGDESTKRYKTGCYETLQQKLNDSLVIIIGVCCGILVLELFALIAAVCVYRGV